MIPTTKLKAITQVLFDNDGKPLSPEDFIVYTARVSNPSNQLNLNTGAKLLKYCIDHNHWSIFEQAHATFEINTNVAIATQILRHRSFCFQQMCVDEDTEIYFDLPRGKRNKNKKNLYKKKIKDLFQSWNDNSFKKKNIQKMNIRLYDTQSKELTHGHIKDIYRSGIKPIFEITLADGKKISTTKEHRFLTKSGFMTLEDAVGINLSTNKTASMSKECFMAVNGVPLYQSYEWMKEQKEYCIKNKLTLDIVAEKAGCSYITIRKWLKKLNLSFSRDEQALQTKIWNKGRFGYKLRPWTKEMREKARKRAKYGKDNPLWRGGVDRSWRLKICDEIAKYRKTFLEKANYQCTDCQISKNLELDHIKPVYSHPELALDHSNIQVLCKNCHAKKHNIAGDAKIYHEKRIGGRTTIKWVKVESIKYIGEKETYDIEVDHPEHNFIANGIVVHNSRRYSSDAMAFDASLTPRSQDLKNRQSSIDNLSHEIKEEFNRRLNKAQYECLDSYEWALSNGVAKECARFLLPQSLATTMYMTGNVRSWIHYFEVRCDLSTQKEHREIALSMRKQLAPYFPTLAEVLNWNE